MRVIQLLPTLSYGDAVGNDTRAIKDLLQELGYETQIYAENIAPGLPRGTVESVQQLPDLAEEDVILYHGSTGTGLNEQLPKLGGRKLMIYHNVTPPHFFASYSQGAKKLAEYGLQGIQGLADKLEYCIADSAFNKQELLSMGYTCPIDVCPILIPFADYKKKPSEKLLRQYRGDGVTNLLFVGRIAPNKCQEDVLRSFFCYQKCYNPKSRLVIVGSWNGMDSYYKRLVAYARMLGIEEHVIFTGHIKFDEILAWYHLADAFVCMSEHEGFCVPLVEAMYFNVPIVAYDSTAIPDTLGGSGVLLESKAPDKAAWEIHRLISQPEHREAVVKGQQKRLADFQYETVSKKLIQLLMEYLKERKKKNPRMIQISPTISRGDAVSNDIMAFHQAFLNMGYPTKIYTEVLPPGKGWENIGAVDQLPLLEPHDIVLYHHATGTNLAKKFAELPCKKVLVYHNVTPPEFFAPFDDGAAQSCRRGLDNLREMKKGVTRCIADSNYNASDLRHAGYTVPIDICPILIPFQDYQRAPEQGTVERYKDGITNIIFVGRVAPNKKFEDVISVFAAYQKLDPKSRLIFVGSYDRNGNYYKFLQKHLQSLHLDHVEFTDHIPFERILAFYQVADVFLCMSEHEGFCVPLVEAMYFDVPVVAYGSTAIPETMGGAGAVLNTKEPETVAQIVYDIVTDDQKKEKMIEAQRKRLKDFSHENVMEILKKTVINIVRDE